MITMRARDEGAIRSHGVVSRVSRFTPYHRSRPDLRQRKVLETTRRKSLSSLLKELGDRLSCERQLDFRGGLSAQPNRDSSSSRVHLPIQVQPLQMRCYSPMRDS